jgi:hypothetical protein
LILNYVLAAEWIRLLIGGTIFLGIYFFASPLTGAVSQTDIKNIKTMFSGLGFISKIIDILLTLLERITKTFSFPALQ